MHLFNYSSLIPLAYAIVFIYVMKYKVCLEKRNLILAIIYILIFFTMCYLHYFMFHYYLTLINLCIPFNLFVHVHIITVLVKNKLARAFSQGFRASVAI